MDLGGDRNAQRILSRMERDGMIKSLRQECKVYYLSNRGKERIGSSQGDLKRDMIKHTLMRNDLYIRLGMPSSWKKEEELKWGENVLIPDATYVKDGKLHFVEVDNQQTMRTNKEKIRKYADLSRIMKKKYGQTFTLVWYTNSQLRSAKLKGECDRYQFSSYILQ